MTTPTPPRADGAPLSSSTGTALEDEEALKRAFLADYAALSAEARADLGDAAVALATKVVEGAFVRAWDAREKIKTPEELHKFLVDDVHHAAARALSRRAAAHRFAAHGTSDAKHATNGDIDPTTSWEHIQHALHGEEHSPSTLAAVAAASRHEAADHIGHVGQSRGAWIAVGVAVVVIAIVISGIFMMNTVAAKGKVAKAVNSADVREVITPAARSGNVDLTDGSKANVAPESKLSIPNAFGPELRGVKLAGAATFDVAPGLKNEFQVYAKNAVVTAKGTSFTVSAYAVDSGVTVVVKDGSVEVRRGEDMQLVPAGATLTVLTSGPLRAATQEEKDEATSWNTGTFTITNKPLRTALARIKRWYGFDIVVPKPEYMQRPVSVSASMDSSMQAIRQVEKSTGLLFGFYGENMAFSDSADKKLRPSDVSDKKLRRR
jgi:ferric-dicitrate binding protein FerR (iron transport regulator)